MKIIRVAAASLNQTPLDWEGNYNRIIKVIDEAYSKDVNILCLPELCITGYGCEDAFLSQNTCNKANLVLNNIAKHLKDKEMLVSVGVPAIFNGSVYNGCSLLWNGTALGTVVKQNLASDGIHYENRWFKPWPKNFRYQELGDIIFNIGGVNIGFEICEDAWVGDRPGISLAKKGVDVILNPSASHFAFGKSEVRKRFVEEGSRAFNCVYVYSNLLGNESGRVIYDGDTYIASDGKIVASGDRFSYKDHTLTIADVDVHKNMLNRMSSASYKSDLEGIHNDFIARHFSYTQNLKIENKISDQKLNKFEEFEMAASLGLFDYLRKSRSKGFVLSLSGGADSSAVACLVRKTIENGTKELGIDGFVDRSGVDVDVPSSLLDISEPGYSKNLPCPTQLITNAWLTCVYQGTNNSSKETKRSAKKLASTIGAKFLDWNISPIHKQYISMIEKSIGRDLTWEQDDITLQNIQARVRSPGIWMMANINNALLLSTSNRSEGSLGYFTLDGDSSGSLSPIAGVDKEFVLSWLNSLKETTFWSKALKDYYKLIPTAELRPKEMEQTDENDLMPYDVLDLIEKMAIRDKNSPQDIKNYLVDVLEHDEEIAKQRVIKFFSLWSKNQFKRERLAPSFHFDDYNLDPRSACRWPILSSNFNYELKNLK